MGGKIKLDLKDKKLLYYYSKNFRIPLNELGKKIGLSKDSVRYRLKRMEDSGIIYKRQAIIDPVRSGHELIEVFLRFQNLTLEKEKELAIYFIYNKQVLVVYPLKGFYDLKILIDAKNMIQFDRTMNEIRNYCGDNLADSMYLIEAFELKFTELCEGYFEGLDLKKESYDKKDSSFEYYLQRFGSLLVKHQEVYVLNEKELKIIDFLNKEPSITLTDLAKKTGYSKDTLKNAIIDLIKGGVLQFFWPLIDYKKIGFDYHLLFIEFNSLDEKENEKLKKYFFNQKFVQRAIKVIGDWDLVVLINARDISHFQELFNDIRKTFEGRIKRFESMLIESPLKFDAIGPFIESEKKPLF